jgi:hypothetical protein
MAGACGVGRLARGSAHSVRKALSAAKIKAWVFMGNLRKINHQTVKQFGLLRLFWITDLINLRICGVFESTQENMEHKTIPSEAQWACCINATEKAFII